MLEAGLHAQVDEDEADHEHQRLAGMLDGGKQRVDQEREQEPQHHPDDEGDLVVGGHLFEAGREGDEMVQRPTADQERQQRAHEREAEHAPIEQAGAVVREVFDRRDGGIEAAGFEAQNTADDGETDRQDYP